MALAAKHPWRPWQTPSEPVRDNRFAPLSILREVAFILILTFTYFLTRGFIRGRKDDAFANARHLISLERTLHVDVESAFQTLVMHHRWLEDFVNVYYLAGHLPVLIGVAVFLYWRHPSSYRWFRNAFLISALIGLSIYVWLPMAPPRYLPGFVDTMAQSGNGLDGSAVGLLYNPYAAMPSLHCGWAALAGFVVLMSARPWWGKLIGLLIPLGMIFTVIATGNHYVLDVVAGLIIIAVSLVLSAWQLVREEDRRKARIVQRAILASVANIAPSAPESTPVQRAIDSGPVAPISGSNAQRVSAGNVEAQQSPAMEK